MKKHVWNRCVFIAVSCSLLFASVFITDGYMDAAVKAQKITLTAKRKTLYQGETYALSVKKVTPAKAVKTVKWTSSRNAVASVSGKGLVKAKKAGKAKITATSVTNRNLKAICSVTVKKGVANRSITLNKEKVNLTVGQKDTLKVAKWNPSNTKVKKVNWMTSDKKIVTVTGKGVINAIAEGTAVVTATNTYGKKAACKVAVNQAVPLATPTAVPAANPTAKPISTPNPSTAPTLAPSPTPGDDLMNNWKTPSNFDASISGVTYGRMEFVQYDSTTTGTKRKCNVLLPPNYSVEKEYPVLYLLHGIGGTHEEWLGGNPRYVIGNLIAKKEAVDMIVVMPNVRAKADDSVPSEVLSQENFDAFDNFINDLNNDLMPYIEEKYPVSTKREDTAIAGLSMGGREALFIGFSMLDRFAYIGAFSPAPGLLPDRQLNYPGQFQEEEFTIGEGEEIPKVVMINVGTSDGVIGNSAQYYHNTLLTNGVKHLWYTMPGGHDFTVWKNGLYQFVKRIFK